MKPAAPTPAAKSKPASPPKSPTSPEGPEPQVGPFPKMPARRRLLIAVLAVATAAAVILAMLRPPSGKLPEYPPRPDAAVCAPGQNQNCVGGAATVIVAPPSR